MREPPLASESFLRYLIEEFFSEGDFDVSTVVTMLTFGLHLVLGVRGLIFDLSVHHRMSFEAISTSWFFDRVEIT